MMASSARVTKLPFLHPAGVTCLALICLVLWVLAMEGGDPLAMARIGTRYSQGDPNGTEGYDGQFVYYIAREINPEKVRPLLDVPAYRYQRILLPLFVRALSFGIPSAIPWVLIFLCIISHTVGTWIVAVLLDNWGVSRWYALGYGLWAGFLLGVRLDLPEPLAFCLLAGALLAQDRRRFWLAWILYSLALFAKEVTLLFVVGAVLAAVLNRRWREFAGLSVVTVAPYLLFQIWLWRVFGQPGIGSGGAMATSFEVVPLMGFLRIGIISPVYFIAMLVVFGPAIIVPAIWGAWAGLNKMRASKFTTLDLDLVINSLVIFFLPFSTVRETGGLIRFGSGLVLSVIMFAAYYRIRKVLNYSFFWLILNLFLFKT
jgi:hypothetical protein